MKKIEKIITKQLALIFVQDTELAELFSVALEIRGFFPKIICDEQAACRWLERQTPAIIILGLNLPDRNNNSCLMQTLHDDRFKETIILSIETDYLFPISPNEEIDLSLRMPINKYQWHNFNISCRQAAMQANFSR